MHESHQAMKYFIKFQQLAARVQWGEAALCRQAYNGLAKHIKDDMVHHEKPKPFPASRNSSKLSMLDTGNNTVNYPAKLALQNLRKQDRTEADSSKSDNKSGKGSLQSKQKNNNSGLYQGKAPLPNRRSPTFLTFPRNSGRTES